MRYSVIIPAREQLSILDPCLASVFRQTIKPYEVILVDDGCEVGADKLLTKYSSKFKVNARYVVFPFKHDNWVGKPELSLVFNYGLDHMELENVDYFMILGSDTVLEPMYVEKLLSKIEWKTAVVSGVIVGETEFKQPRGSGRLINAGWWLKYVKRFPLCWSWESYPLYKALATDWRIQVVLEAIMKVKRATRTHVYKRFYGYTMRELGYYPWYAFLKCIKAVISSPREGLGMLYTYLTSPYRVVDEDIARWVRRWQVSRIASFFSLR